ncbi:type II toxin-antitoxin system RelE/ParE family toxin [Sphingomonas sp. RT2P30]|uniref:hypothetical protein n=1 Tax=Parasphingomonas halimpatiens TaxID=3096162 RepID=UPI002FC89E85
MLALAEGPDALTAKPSDDIAPGLRILHTARFGRRARHMLLYRVGSSTVIDVVRILHDAMELERHVPSGDG